jgi:hypothetical protein
MRQSHIAHAPAHATDTERIVQRLFAVCSYAEIAVGIAALAFPQVVSLLLDAALDAHGLLVARMLGVAALAFGITWRGARRDPRSAPRYAVGFVIYNLGVGTLFGIGAAAAERSAVPWLVAAFHLGAAAIAVALARRVDR